MRNFFGARTHDYRPGDTVGMRAFVAVLFLALATCATCAARGGGAAPHVAAYFVAGVLEHEPYQNTSSSPQEILSQNLDAYAAAVVAGAAAGMELLVLPEFGLFGSAGLSSRAAAVPFSEVVPSVAAMAESSLVPCGNASFAPYPIMQTLSCLAQRYGVVIVANMIDAPDSTGDLYNTALVLAADGSLVTKYWKSHPWYTHIFTKPPAPDIVSFASLGTRFGLFICFDIAFDSPGPVLVRDGVRQFPYASSEGQVGPAIVGAWSALHRSTVLASNLGLGSSSVWVNGSTLHAQQLATLWNADRLLVVEVPVN